MSYVQTVVDVAIEKSMERHVFANDHGSRRFHDCTKKLGHCHNLFISIDMPLVLY